jgi:hypothetical protein
MASLKPKHVAANLYYDQQMHNNSTNYHILGQHYSNINIQTVYTATTQTVHTATTQTVYTATTQTVYTATTQTDCMRIVATQ